MTTMEKVKIQIMCMVAFMIICAGVGIHIVLKNGEPQGAFGYEFGQNVDTSTAVFDTIEGNYVYTVTDTITPPIGGVQIVKVYSTPKSGTIFQIKAISEPVLDSQNLVTISRFDYDSTKGTDYNYQQARSKRGYINACEESFVYKTFADIQHILLQKYGERDTQKHRYGSFDETIDQFTRGFVVIRYRKTHMNTVVVNYIHNSFQSRLERETNSIKKEQRKVFLLTEEGINF